MIDSVSARGGANIAKGAVSATTAYMLARHLHGKKDATGAVPVVLAVAGKIVPALAALFVGDDLGMAGPALGALDAAGQGALDFLAIAKGLQHARKEKGLRTVAIPAGADMKGLPGGSVTDAALLGEDVAVLGALGRAQPGATLDQDKLRTLQQYR